MTPLHSSASAQIYHCDWQALLDVVPECDLLLVDAPYSAKTHAGHDSGVAEHQADNPRGRDYRVAHPSGGTGSRRSINYAAWGAAEVDAFVAAWGPRTRGWFVTVTDHVLAEVWKDALEAQGRYVFAPLPFVHPGRGVRLSGDGPSSWTCWIVAARPRSAAYSKWGTLPGAYVQPTGKGAQGYRSPVVGGKTTWLACRLVEDYSRPGDLVVDPCCGAGCFPVGAVQMGRRAIAGDVDAAHAATAAQWIQRPHGPPPGGTEEVNPEQGRLL